MTPRLPLYALPLLLMLASCAAPSPVLPQVVPPPQIPPPPQVTAPAPQGSYWAKVCNYRQSLQETLKLTLTPIEPCLLGGPDKPQPNVR